jgi:hypothetical protein
VQIEEIGDSDRYRVYHAIGTNSRGIH